MSGNQYPDPGLGQTDDNALEGATAGTWMVTEQQAPDSEDDPFPEVYVEPGGTAAAPIADPAPLSDTDFLRVVLQEVIPPGGADSDTLFLDEHIIAFLNRSNGLMSAAAAMGWATKAGALAVMVDRNDGLAERKLSQASVAAQKIAAYWREIAVSDAAQLGRSVATPGAVAAVWTYSATDLYNQVWDASHIDRFWLPWNVIEG